MVWLVITAVVLGLIIAGLVMLFDNQQPTPKKQNPPKTRWDSWVNSSTDDDYLHYRIAQKRARKRILKNQQKN